MHKLSQKGSNHLYRIELLSLSPDGPWEIEGGVEHCVERHEFSACCGGWGIELNPFLVSFSFALPADIAQNPGG
jgi:hypothetical protein